MAKSYAQYDETSSSDSVDLASDQTITGAKTFTGATAINAALTQAPTASASGNRTLLTLTQPADLARTASTEQSSIYLNLGATVTFATGALTNQRALRIAAPTYAFAGASTLTNASTVYISDAPAAGTNATITNAYALFVDAGRVRFDGAVVQNTYPVLQVTGTDASPATTTPAGVTRSTTAARGVTEDRTSGIRTTSSTAHAIPVVRMASRCASVMVRPNAARRVMVADTAAAAAMMRATGSRSGRVGVFILRLLRCGARTGPRRWRPGP